MQRGTAACCEIQQPPTPHCRIGREGQGQGQTLYGKMQASFGYCTVLSYTHGSARGSIKDETLSTRSRSSSQRKASSPCTGSYSTACTCEQSSRAFAPPPVLCMQLALDYSVCVGCQKRQHPFGRVSRDSQQRGDRNCPGSYMDPVVHFSHKEYLALSCL